MNANKPKMSDQPTLKKLPAINKIRRRIQLPRKDAGSHS